MSEHLLMAVVSDEGWEESEPVLVERNGETVHLTLDDGTDITLSVDVLRDALAA